MPTGFPCPNPSCTHVFSSDAVQGAAAIACPLCGARYRFRNATPPPPLPKVMPPPMPALGRSSGPLIRPRRRRRNLGWLKAVVVFLTVSLCVGGVLYRYRDELADMFRDGPGQLLALQKQANFSFRATGGWRSDEALRDKMRANLAVSLDRPRGHMALFYLDHPARAFRDGQLLDRALRHLRAYFPVLEYEDPFADGGEGRTGTLDGEPAVVFPFSGADTAEVPIRGQAYILSRQGFTYWLYFWGPEDNFDQLADRWETLRRGFQVYNEREGWKPRPPETETFVGPSGYELRYLKNVWKAEPNPKDADPACELYLRGFEGEEDDRTGKRRVGATIAGKAAEVMVLALPAAADSRAAALAHLTKRYTETNPGLKVEALPERGKGRPDGGLFGRIERVRLVLAPDHERFAVLAAAGRSGGVLAVVCECSWDRKDYWEQEFRAIVDSVRPSEKPGTPAPPPETPKAPERPPETKGAGS